MELQKGSFKSVLNAAVIVAALGYFVDVYDLVLFLVIGVQSILDIGVPAESKIKEFQFLLNTQMIGMLVGGLVWGILGDKKGRLSVLFGSILVYSIANIANGFVIELAHLFGTEVTFMYALLRFIAGFGLAGELGAGITLVSEVVSKENRGYGTMIVASVGVTGAVVAALVGKSLGWQVAYFVGGGLGLSLLLLRIGVFESGMFEKIHQNNVSKGNFFALFKNPKIAFKYINCILIGLPVWFVIGLLIGRAPEYAVLLGVKGIIDREYCILFCYTGLIFGDIASGTISQLLKSRIKVFYIFYAFCAIVIWFYLSVHGLSTAVFYLFIGILGFSVGFWAMFVTVASEQFGTNLRATTTTTVPNFVRGSLVPVSMLYEYINERSGMIQAGYIVTAVTLVVAVFSLYNLQDTFGKDLDYVE
ncbi:MAG TPA: MFS transporter [Cytophagaceae bacterium]|nr:MFS transporter [Cytophagaceae bacterium]